MEARDGDEHDHLGAGARARRTDADRGAAADRGHVRGHRRRTHARRRRLVDLDGAPRPGRCGGGRAGGARDPPGRRRGDHARQPPGVPHRRLGRGHSRGDAVLDLRHLSAGGDPVSVPRLRRPRGDRRAGVPARDPRGAPRPRFARARRGGRWRGAGGHALAGRGGGFGSGLRRRGGRVRSGERRPPHADLHLRHHRPTQGGPALASQRDGGGPGDGGDHRPAAGLPRDLLAAGRAHRRADGAPLHPDRVRRHDHLLPEPARGRLLPPAGPADLVLRGAADLGEAQSRARGDAGGPARGAARTGAGRPPGGDRARAAETTRGARPARARGEGRRGRRADLLEAARDRWASTRRSRSTWARRPRRSR